MGLSLDWAGSSPPATQAITSTSRHVPRLPAAGLVSEKQSKVNGDPVDQTVLANEHDRRPRLARGALVEQRELTQWFFKTANIRGAARALDTLDAGPTRCG